MLKNTKTKIMIATIATPKNIEKIEEFNHLISKIKQPNFVEWLLLRPIPNALNSQPISRQDVKNLYNKIKQYNIQTKISNSIPFCIAEGISEIAKGGHFDSGYLNPIH